MKNYIKIFLFIFLSVASISWGQTAPSSQPQTQQSPMEESHLFNKADAPITYKGAFIKMMLTLAAMIGLIVLSVVMLKRISRGRMQQLNNGRTIKILERRPISPKSVLYLVEVEGKKIVIAESQIEVRHISTADTLNK